MVAKNSGTVKRIAAERIGILYGLAKGAYSNNEVELSRRYTKLLLRISQHYRIKLDRHMKIGICKKCGSPLIAGINLRVRAASSNRRMVYKCIDCGTERSIPY
ncbi:MAG: ribonuclease P protein component 4 [Candidatus Micrarchaeaceae archaeon]